MKSPREDGTIHGPLEAWNTVSKKATTCLRELSQRSSGPADPPSRPPWKFATGPLLSTAPFPPARPPWKRKLHMGHVSTDTCVSHHTGYPGTDKDTPQEMHLSEEKCTPNNKENSSRKREQKTRKFSL